MTKKNLKGAGQVMCPVAMKIIGEKQCHLLSTVFEEVVPVDRLPEGIWFTDEHQSECLNCPCHGEAYIQENMEQELH